MSSPTSPQDKLDEIITDFGLAAVFHGINQGNPMPNSPVLEILDLFAHLASEAKPEKKYPENNNYQVIHNKAIDTYHQNLLRAIGKQ